MIGQALSHFRINALLGEGGMGKVYQATDTQLEREVAIKVLPEGFADDKDRARRFEQEARVLASLNHPGIATIHGFESEGNIRFLVMELVPGETLADRIARGPVPVDEALLIALQVAEGIEFAHEQGVVHRDVKPANVKQAPTGQVKLLDFGLAKAMQPDSRSIGSEAHSDAPTGTHDATRSGVVLGTAAYMSPEQARGEAVGKHADIWSFGCLLYEMLTGCRLFKGDTAADVIAAIMTQELAMEALPMCLSPSVRVLLERCLERDSRRRLRDIGEARIALRNEIDGVEGSALPSAAGVPHIASDSQPSSRSRLPWLTAAAFAALAAIVGLNWLWSRETPPVLQQSLLGPPAGAVLREASGFALSPDGQRLAFVARDAAGVDMLWIRSLDELEPRLVIGSEEAWKPFWSPDGRDVGFFADGSVKRVPAVGGAVRVLASGVTDPRGGTWSRDDRIAYSVRRVGLFEVPASGGKPVALTTVDVEAGELDHRWPQFLPDGQTLLFLVQTAELGATDDRSRIEVLDAGGTRRELLRVNSSSVYVAPGWLLYWREGSIWAQEFDLRRLQLSGEPRRLADDVGITTNEWAKFSVSEGGTLVYLLSPLIPWRMEWRDRAGRLLGELAPDGEYLDPALSPDGARLAYVGDNVLWVLDIARGTTTRLSFEEVDHYSPAWGPGGEWLTYVADKSSEPGQEIYRRASSSVGERQVLYSDDNLIYWASLSPDGNWVAFESTDDIWLLDLVSGDVRVRVDSPGVDMFPAWSPDGQWLAYNSDESGRSEVYVVPAFDETGKWQVSIRGGAQPRWASEGDEILFRGLDYEIRVAPVELDDEPEFGSPEGLFTIPGASPGSSFEIAGDGRLLIRAQPGRGAETLVLVQNWLQLLEEPGS